MNPAARIGGLGITLFAAWLFAPSARADIISDEEGVCRGKAKGDACEVRGKLGACGEATCSFNDYSSGTPPKAGERPCMQCVLGNVTKDTKDGSTPTHTDAKVDAKTDANLGAKTDAILDADVDAKVDVITADAKVDAKAVDAKAVDAKAADAKAVDAKAVDASKSSASGCQVDGATHGAGLLLGLGLLALARRDRPPLR
ncbi:MAG: hypothetical protein IAG13_25035 [Deltaproteobacteria bacterium]|nr:hypothetical protein [Nannocystaceae bacterium]